MQQSGDTHAQTVVFYASMANALSSTLGSYFTPPSLNKMGAMDGDGPWEYSWKEGELTVTVKIAIVVDQYVWEAYYSGKINDISVNNFLAVKAQQALNERSGNFESYQPPLSTVQATYSWSLDSAESLLFQVIASTFQQGGKFVGKSNVDQSGELLVYKLQGQDYVINQQFLWHRQGTGEWWDFTNGVVDSSGVWN
ncbi:MAG: hypothetical protein EHM72_15530 [Calditrichaeota bacterium]|nr:MAG: hypothetical protein EHM72_15530 [Calditrichota bacterium]